MYTQPKNPAFVTTSLYTKLGEFVTTVEVPPFTPKAEILQWGSRYFVYDKEQDKYLEGLTYWCGNHLSNPIPRFEK